MVELVNLKQYYLLLAPVAYLGGVIASFEFGMHNFAAKKITAASQQEFYQTLSKNIEYYSSLNVVLFMNILVASGTRGLSSFGLEDVADDAAVYFNFGITAPFMYLGLYHGFKLNNKLYELGMLKVKKSNLLTKFKELRLIQKLIGKLRKSNQLPSEVNDERFGELVLASELGEFGLGGYVVKSSLEAIANQAEIKHSD